MEKQFNHFIAGGGLGGLLTAALLSQRGQKCYLVEKSPFFGGRFTSHNIDGFEVPTGAVHMVPHSRNGPLGEILLHNLKLPLEIHDNEYFTAWYWPNRKPIYHRKFWGIFKAFKKKRQGLFVIRKLLASIRHSEDRLESFYEYWKARTEDPQIFDFFNAITGFALSLDISQISTASMFRVFRKLYHYGCPGVPIGGCKAVTKALIDFIQSNGSIIKKNCELIKLEVNNSLVESAVCRNRKTNEEFIVQADNFILNLGHCQINNILSNNQLLYRLPVTPIAQGGGFVYKSKSSILKTSVIAQFPKNKYVKGAVEPTTLSPNLAPPNEHLLLTHQVFHSSDIAQDTRRARDELLETFPQLKEEDELFVHTFHKEWPVNFATQGKDLPNFSDEISNLFFVGDGFKGNNGWIMTEGVAYGVKQIIQKISNKRLKTDMH